MRVLNNEYKDRKIEISKLKEYGFIYKDNTYIFTKDIIDNTFTIIIEIKNNKITTKLIDNIVNDEFLMIDIKNTTGEYVGKIKEEYDKVINDFIDKCTTSNIFKNKQTKEIIKYIKNKYNDELEFLWSKFPSTAIWRNKNNNKWYGIIMIIAENKLGIKSDKEVEVIDLRYSKEDINNIVDNKKIFPGYHMNKKSWITIKLDETININNIYTLIDNSYNLSKKNIKD